jgi:hypothetical protein
VGSHGPFAELSTKKTEGTMKTVNRKIIHFAATVAVVLGMSLVAAPKANASKYICFLQGCDANYCYNNCYYVGE